MAQVVRETTTAVMAEAEQARAQTEQAEADKTAMAQTAATERAAIMEAADTRVRFAELLPKDFDPKDKSTKDILVAAVGQEVEKPTEQDAGYLKAKAEGILERRSAAPTPGERTTTQPGGGTVRLSAYAIHQLEEAS